MLHARTARANLYAQAPKIVNKKTFITKLGNQMSSFGSPRHHILKNQTQEQQFMKNNSFRQKKNQKSYFFENRPKKVNKDQVPGFYSNRKDRAEQKAGEKYKNEKRKSQSPSEKEIVVSENKDGPNKKSLNEDVCFQTQQPNMSILASGRFKQFQQNLLNNGCKMGENKTNSRDK